MATQHFTLEISEDLVRVHEQYLVPAIYAQWAGRVAEIAEIEFGHHVLDVACGTGTLARAAQLETGLAGQVTGLDASELMLESAQRQSPGIKWQIGDATSMPFDKNRFDRVLCQFSLMFINNRVATIKEMLRVCKTDGLVVVATWGPVHHGGAYDKLNKLVNQFCGSHASMKLSSPWALGKSGVMDSLLLSSGVNEYECHERFGQARYPSMRAFIEAHLRLAGEFDDLSEKTHQELLSAANTQLHQFLTPDGGLIAQLNANIFVIRPG
jgi:ubiquinone/menaquinone biosynthesis C-methylase UbiE